MLRRARCALLGHRVDDTGNRWGAFPILRCRRCGRVWFGRDELLDLPRPFGKGW